MVRIVLGQFTLQSSRGVNGGGSRCRGYYTALQFASFLASWSAIEALDWPTSIPTLVHGYVRTQAAPYLGNMSAEIQKAGPIGIFTRYSTTLVSRCFSRAWQELKICQLKNYARKLQSTGVFRDTIPAVGGLLEIDEEPSPPNSSENKTGFFLAYDDIQLVETPTEQSFIYYPYISDGSVVLLTVPINET
ncbi:hypothetical protein G5I_04956 [Acromyrmex echinatior]|uniref:Uncharacterized protein n=1 Tax=Acromyrmex echinatior TaxID=103372 RepID=F4WH04_ACREC|nr:hypothetical protein G5I_04956 [Acromyrmex echinatior]